MIEQQMSEGLQILNKFFAIKTQLPETESPASVPPAAPAPSQALAPMPVAQTPSVKPYEPIGRGPVPKIIFTVIVLGLFAFFVKRNDKKRKDGH
jgi:hypothetical protein